ncbi:MAG: endonuclease [Frankiales bacterium]|nr:endonuclease [Frankiales bacterium]
MRELRSALDALAAEDLSGLVGPPLLDRTAELLSARNRIDAELARTVRECELTQAPQFDGLASMASWLRGHARLSPVAAARLVTNGRALERLPAVAGGCADGLVSAEQVSVIAPLVAPEHLAAATAQGVELAGVDATLAEVAATRPSAELRRVAQHYLARLHPDGPEPDPSEQRSLTLSRHADGSLSLRGELDAVGGEKLQAAIEALVQGHRPAGDTRTRAQRQGDALVQLVDNELASGTLPFLRRVKPHLLITIGLPDLLDPTTAPAVAEARFGATLSAARTRWAACDPDITRIVLDPDGRPLDLGRTVRLVPPHLRRAVEHRDRGCVFAGCDAPTHWCDVHHVLEWVLDGGETSLDNSALLCERHHTKVHHGFRVERHPDGRWHTWRPDGTQILVLPHSEPARPTTRAG